MTIKVTCNTPGCTLFAGTNTTTVDLSGELGRRYPRVLGRFVQRDLRYRTDGSPELEGLRILEEVKAFIEVERHQAKAVLAYENMLEQADPNGILYRDARARRNAALEMRPHNVVTPQWEAPAENAYLSKDYVLQHPELMRPAWVERG